MAKKAVTKTEEKKSSPSVPAAPPPAGGQPKAAKGQGKPGGKSKGK